MTPPVPVANAMKISFLHGLGADAPAGCSVFFNFTGGPMTNTIANALATSASSQYSSHVAALLSSTFGMDGVTVTDLSSTSGAFGENTSSVAGTRSGTALPVNSCTVVDYVIQRRYRGGKPKGFWPWGVAGDLTTSQKWSTSYQSAVNTAFGAFISGLSGISSGGVAAGNHISIGYFGGPFTIYYGSGGRPKVRQGKLTTPNQDQVSTHLARQVVGSQRRRLTAP